MKKRVFIVGLLIVIVCLVAGWWLRPRPDAKAQAAATLKQIAAGQATFPAEPRPARLNRKPGRGDRDNLDPMSRVALRYVGVDTNAEAYWIAAINDPTLSRAERENLISDLNEDGLSDFKHPTAADLVIIRNRLALIERLAPDAMDAVNAATFKEAHDDLANLAEIAEGRGKPVQ